MRLQMTHITRYAYASPVSHCLNEVRLRPRTLPGQTVHETSFRVDPEPAFVHHRRDYFGNDVTSFEIFERHDRFEATAESVVEVRPEAEGPDPALTWEEARDVLARLPDPVSLAASEFVCHSPFVPVVPALGDYAREVFGPRRSLLDTARELMGRIHADFSYRPDSTSIDMPLADVLSNRRGVCQDFAHVMIGVLRSRRLAARYVSGYVRPGPEVQGAQASHAWVAIFFPGRGWFGFDPTNNLVVSDSHVTLAWGRDYGDVTPVKGVTLGGTGQSVSVEVYVRPVERGV